MQVFTESTSGSYVGIGVSLNMDSDGLMTVVEAFNGIPGKRSGNNAGRQDSQS